MQKEKGSEFSKNDLWIVSEYQDFKDCFILKSMWHGFTKHMVIEMAQIIGGARKEQIQNIKPKICCHGIKVAGGIIYI